MLKCETEAVAMQPLELPPPECSLKGKERAKVRVGKVCTITMLG